MYTRRFVLIIGVSGVTIFVHVCVHFGIVEMRGGDGLVSGRMKLDVWVHLLGFGLCGSSFV